MTLQILFEYEKGEEEAEEIQRIRQYPRQTVMREDPALHTYPVNHKAEKCEAEDKTHQGL